MSLNKILKVKLNVRNYQELGRRNYQDQLLVKYYHFFLEEILPVKGLYT